MYSLKKISFDNVIPNEMSLDRDFLRLLILGVGRFIVFAPLYFLIVFHD
jgi:hypothetical protein